MPDNKQEPAGRFRFAFQFKNPPTDTNNVLVDHKYESYLHELDEEVEIVREYLREHIEHGISNHNLHASIDANDHVRINLTPRP